MSHDILMIAPTYFFSHRGTPARIFNQLGVLLSQGKKVSLITYPRGELPLDQKYTSRLSVYRPGSIFSRVLTNQAGPSLVRIVLDILILFRAIILVINNPHTVIHTYLHEGAGIGWIVKKIFFWRDVMMISDMHSSFSEEMKEYGYRTSFFSWIEKNIFSLNDIVFTASSPGLQLYIARYARHSFYIPDTPFFDQYYYIHHNNKYNFSSPETLNIVYTGGFTQDKGIKEFLDSINTPLLQKYKMVHYIIAGSPKSILEPIVARHLLKDQIVLVDPCNFEVTRKLIGNAYLCIDPKTHTGKQASVKLLEYISLSKPVVCFGTDYQKEILGELYPFSSPDTLVSNIMRLLDNGGEYESLRTKILDAQKKIITSDQLGELLEKIYNKKYE